MPPTQPAILIVDDDPATSTLLVEVFEDQGYAVERADSGAAGQARLAGGGIDLLVVDRRLPDMDGLEFCHWLRARERDRHVPVIVLTALADEAERQAGLTAGADAYLGKPFDLDALLQQVTERLAPLPARRADPSPARES